MGYLAACTLSNQTTNATLDVQASSLFPSSPQASPQPWQLWAPGIEDSTDLVALVR